MKRWTIIGFVFSTYLAALFAAGCKPEPIDLPKVEIEIIQPDEPEVELLDIVIDQGPQPTPAIRIAHPRIERDGYALKPHVLFFGADWCEPCRRLKPTIDDLRATYRIYGFEDVHHRSIANEWGVGIYPTAIFMRNGIEVARKAGVNEGQLRTMCSRYAK